MLERANVKPFSVGPFMKSVRCFFWVLLMLAYRLLSFSEHSTRSVCCYLCHARSNHCMNTEQSAKREKDKKKTTTTTHWRNATTLRCFLSFDLFFSPYLCYVYIYLYCVGYGCKSVSVCNMNVYANGGLFVIFP